MKKKTKSMSPKQILAYIAFIIAVVWTLKFVFELSSSGVKQVTSTVTKQNTPKVTKQDTPTVTKPDYLHLSCVAADNTMTTRVIIDSDNNIASVQSNLAKLQTSRDQYAMEYDMGKISVKFIIDRNSGLYQEFWTAGSKIEYFHGKCEVSKQKF